MTKLDLLRNEIIEKILSINNKEYLNALHQIVENADLKSKTHLLTKEQKLMLALSEEDINHKRTISHRSLMKSKLEWLKEK